MELYIVDGTYELFRAHFGYPSRTSPNGQEVGALKGYINHLQSLQKKYSYLAVCFDSTVESFRNDLYVDYKSSKGIEVEVLNQFSLTEEVTKLLGIQLIATKEFEADDAIASICENFKNSKIKIVIGSLDKDLMQCVDDEKIVMYSTRYKKFTNADDVYEKFGIHPFQIPDFLALTGDSSDGIPGIKGVGQVTASKLLSEFENVENIIENLDQIRSNYRGGDKLVDNISQNIKELKLFKTLTTLRKDVDIPKEIEMYEQQKINEKKLDEFSKLHNLNINIAK